MGFSISRSETGRLDIHLDGTTYQKIQDITLLFLNKFSFSSIEIIEVDEITENRIRVSPHRETLPVQVKYCRERIGNFKGTVIKEWTGHFWLEGKPEFLQFALAMGLGSINSAGFGFIEKVGKRQRIVFLSKINP